MLIIEDDLDYRNRLSDFLSSRGCDVSIAENGEQAMDKLLFHRPSLVVLDMLLPKVDGFGVLEKIRGYPDQEVAATPILVLSNLSGQEDVEKASKYNLVAYLIKSQVTFEDVLNKALDAIYHGSPPPSSLIMDIDLSGNNQYSN